MTSADDIILRSQLAGANRPYEIDIGERAISAWVPNASIAAGAHTRPSSGHETGFLYQANAAGQTGALEPAWSTTLGGTTPDGSLIWTTVAPPAIGEDTIQSVAWTQQSPPDGALTITSESLDALTASAYLGGGTVGNTYTVLAEITMVSGAIHPVRIVLTIL